MKTQAKTLLEFKKTDIIELNSAQLNLINGGTDTQTKITSSLPCIGDALSISPDTFDPNGSQNLCNTITSKEAGD